jgi:hypothetical protein
MSNHEDAIGRIRSRDDAAEVVKRAVDAERERCAKIADKVAENNRGGMSPSMHAAFTVSLEIARYVRRGS